MIYVCDNCLQASCWAGIFMCWESRGAGLFRARRSDILKLGREHECYTRLAQVAAPRDDRKTPMVPRSVLRDAMGVQA